MALLWPIAAWSYDPPTPEELAGWWASLTTEERFEQIYKLDAIEHSEPLLSLPEQVIVQTKDGIIRSYYTEPLIVDIAGHLRYSITLPEAEIQGELPTKIWKPAVIGFLAGAAAGAILTAILSK